MDLYDDPRNPYITAMLEVPGMKPEQLSVRIEKGSLIVEGERTGPHLHMWNRTDASTTSSRFTNATPPEPSAGAAPAPAVDETTLYSVQELKYGRFRREIALPAGVNVSLLVRLNDPSRNQRGRSASRRRWPRMAASRQAGRSRGAAELMTKSELRLKRMSSRHHAHVGLHAERLKDPSKLLGMRTSSI